MQPLLWKRPVIIAILVGLISNACGFLSQSQVNQGVSATLTAEAQYASSQQQKAEEYMDKYGFVPIATGDSEFAVVAIASNGEKMAVMTEADNSGSITAVKGAVWISPNDEVIVMYMSEDGLPERLIVQEHVLLFSNYTETTVDIAVISPDGTININRRLPIALNKIRGHSFLLPHRVASKIALIRSQNKSLSLVDALDMAGIVLGAGLCAASVMGTIGTGGALIPVLIKGCGSFLLGILISLAPEKLKALEPVALAIKAYKCTDAAVNPLKLEEFDVVKDCGTLILSIAKYAAKWASESEERVNDSEVLAKAALKYGSGSVQITLTWDNGADIDLWVTEPDGEKIGFEHPSSDTSGTLDVDDTDGYGPENIFWPYGQAPSGKYIVQVNHYSGVSPTNYKVLVQVNGQAQTFSGTISSGEWVEITTFDQ
jgi:hypothetical protein